MTKVWFMREGSDPTTGSAAYAGLYLEQCIDRLGLDKRQWLHGLERAPRFGKQRPPTTAEYIHAVCQVDEPEASDEGWMAGYYLLEISPKEVAQRLGPPG